MQQIIPYLWFNDQAEEAVNHYVSIFNNSKIDRISRYGETGPGKPGSAMVIEFQLEGQDFMALNGGSGAGNPGAPYPGSVALFISCESQSEVDRLWDVLSDGGKKLPCGWVTDKYGFTWNIVPQGIGDYIAGDDPERADRAMKAMLQMEKLDIDELRRAYEGAPA
ncbi:MAG TPA: VOC family protein [Candidatus Baltobacteraceae bacterium]|jgi:predicted 3-demethylubiquinone-9 3-methyltransferase (glyoxalase superfamily)|nr:VOC family protein [Candidatus Baltobacteraceae bacterium]